MLAGLIAFVVMTSVLGSNAHAVSSSFVGAANIDTGVPPGVGAPGNGVNLINGNSSAGNQYINNITSNVAGTGGDIRAVGANLLSSYQLQLGGVTNATFNGNQLVVVFAIQGNATGGFSPVVFTATGGRAAFFQIPTGTFNVFNPITWGATNATGATLSTPIAVWDLKPSEFVVDNPSGGGPGIFNLAPGQVNQASVNTTVGAANQGFFLLRETQNATFSGPPGALSGNGFVDLVTNPLPPGVNKIDEGLVSRVDESYFIATTTNTSPVSGGPGTPGFDALNTIACQLSGLSDLVPGGTCQGFANGFGGLGIGGGDPLNFNPSTGNPLPNTSDALFTFGTTSSPTAQGNIPEPGTLLLLGVGLVALVAYSRHKSGKA